MYTGSNRRFATIPEIERSRNLIKRENYVNRRRNVKSFRRFENINASGVQWFPTFPFGRHNFPVGVAVRAKSTAVFIESLS